LGPWAFDSGPSTPVTMNCGTGFHCSCKNLRKGIDPPSAMVNFSAPKYLLDAFLNISSNSGVKEGALNPEAAFVSLGRQVT